MQADTFFGVHIVSTTLGGQAMALLLAVLLGGAIGLERELRGQAAGLRTHILVCVGATLMTLVSVAFGRGLIGGVPQDPARLAAQIVTGIGFLGAGAIIRDGMTIHGLTTAASVWTTAGIGIAIGAAPRLGELALVATVIVLATLIALNWLEDALRLKQRFRTLRMQVREADHGTARVLARLAEQGILVYGVQSEPATTGADPTRQLQMRVRLPGAFNRNTFNTLLTEEPGVVQFHLD